MFADAVHDTSPFSLLDSQHEASTVILDHQAVLFVKSKYVTIFRCELAPDLKKASHTNAPRGCLILNVKYAKGVMDIGAIMQPFLQRVLLNTVSLTLRFEDGMTLDDASLHIVLLSFPVLKEINIMDNVPRVSLFRVLMSKRKGLDTFVSNDNDTAAPFSQPSVLLPMLRSVSLHCSCLASDAAFLTVEEFLAWGKRERFPISNITFTGGKEAKVNYGAVRGSWAQIWWVYSFVAFTESE